MSQNAVEYQLSSLKTHPHTKKIEFINSRLIQLVYYPKNVKCPLANYEYRIKIELPANYPESPPVVKFVDPIDHINVCSRTGQVHMPILEEDWSPYISLYIIVDVIDTLLTEPENQLRYCVNRKPLKGRKAIEQSKKFQKKISVSEVQSIRNGKYEEDKFGKGFPNFNNNSHYQQSCQDDRPIQTMKNKLKRLKTIILERAENYVPSSEKYERESIQIQHINIPMLSKISEQVRMSNLKNQNVIYSPAKKDINYIIPQTTKKITMASTLHRANSNDKKNQIDSNARCFYSPHQKNNQNFEKGKDLVENISTKQSAPIRNIPTLKRNTIDEDIFSGVNKDLGNSGSLEQTKHQLQKIKDLIDTFTKKRKANNQQLLKIIDCKIGEQIQMIQELQQLSSTLKKQMISILKKQMAGR